MPEFSINDWLAYGLIVLIVLVFVSAYIITRLKKSSKNPPEEKTIINAILHRSSERGEGIIVGLSDGDGGQMGSLAGLSGLQSQSHIFKHSLISDIPPKALAGDGNLVALSQQLTAGIYRDAVMPELFRMESSVLAGLGAYPYLAGLMPELSRPNLNALVLQGELNPELVLALDLAERRQLQSVVASASLSGQAAAFLATEHSALGEEAFLSQSNQPRKRAGIEATLLTLRIVRGVLIGGLFLAILLYFLWVLP